MRKVCSRNKTERRHRIKKTEYGSNYYKLTTAMEAINLNSIYKRVYPLVGDPFPDSLDIIELVNPEATNGEKIRKTKLGRTT